MMENHFLANKNRYRNDQQITLRKTRRSNDATERTSNKK